MGDRRKGGIQTAILGWRAVNISDGRDQGCTPGALLSGRGWWGRRRGVSTGLRLRNSSQTSRRAQIRTAAAAARPNAPILHFGGWKGPQLGPAGSAREVRVPLGRRHATVPGAASTGRVRQQ